MIYFDDSAITIPYPEVLRTHQEVTNKIFGNPSSLYNLGTKASRILETSCKQIADLLGVKSTEIIFTSGGTESDNWVLKGVAFEEERYGKRIIVPDIEHPAVKESVKWLSEHGFNVSYASVNGQGFVDVKALAALLRPGTTLVSIMAVSNGISSIQPIKETSELLADKPGISFHVDAVQAIGKVPAADYLTDCVNFASFSGHKSHSVRGVDFTCKKEGKKLDPLLAGDGQEGDLRSTTENVTGIAVTAKALRLMTDKEAYALPKTTKMKEVIYDELTKHKNIVILSGKDDTFAPNILTFGIKGVRGEVVVHAFEGHEIYISTTSTYSSKAGKSAGTLIAMGVPVKLAQSAVRISLDDDGDMGRVEQLLMIFKQIYEEIKKVR